MRIKGGGGGRIPPLGGGFGSRAGSVGLGGGEAFLTLTGDAFLVATPVVLAGAGAAGVAAATACLTGAGAGAAAFLAALTGGTTRGASFVAAVFTRGG